MDQFELLTSPEQRKKVLAEAERKAINLTSAEHKALRRLAKKSLFTLGHAILGYDKMTANLHLAQSEWYQKEAVKKQHRMILWPRGHYKSTLFNVTETVQTLLPDDDGDSPWPNCLGSNARVIIFHAIEKKAIAFLQAITAHFLSNVELLSLFPEVLPDARKQTVSKFELELPRTKIYPEASVTAAGRKGSTQGGHYNKLKLDDIIGENDRDSEIEMAAAKEWFDNHRSLFSSFNHDVCDVIGTRWAYDDVYSHAMEKYGDRMATSIISFYTTDSDGRQVPVFPEEFSDENVRELKQNRRVWTAQYLNNPSQSDTGFNPSWQRFYSYVTPKEIIYKDLFAGTTTGYSSVSTSQLDIVFLIDPAPKGEYGFIITGTDKFGRNFVLEAIKRDMQAHQFCNLIFDKVRFWNPRLVGIEFVNFSEVYKPWFEQEMRQRQVYFRIEGLRTRNAVKNQRIEALSNYFSNGLIFFNETQASLLKEYAEFGATTSTHLLDALAYGPVVWRKFDGSRSNISSNKSDLDAKTRDPISGYTPIVLMRG